VGWDPTNKSADAIIESSGSGVANDEFREDGVGTGDWAQAVSSFTLSGKVYFEWTAFNDGSADIEAHVGVVNESWDETSQSIGIGRDAGNSLANTISKSVSTVNRKYKDNSFTDLRTNDPGDVQGSVFMLAFDVATGDIWFGEGGTWHEGDPAAGTGASLNLTGTTFRLGASLFDNEGNGVRGFFNASSQTHTPPTGFSAPESDPATPLAPANLEQTQETTQSVLDADPDFLAPAALEQLQTLSQPSLDPRISPANLEQAQEATQPVLSFTELLAANNLEQTQETTQPGLEFTPVNYSGTAVLPWLVSGAGSFIVGTGYQGTPDLPAIDAELFDGYQGNVGLSPISASGTAEFGLLLSGTWTLPAIRAVATGAVDGDFGGIVSLPVVTASGTLLSGGVYSGDFVVPGLVSEGIFVPEVVISGTWVLPSVGADGVLLTGSLFSGTTALPWLVAEGQFENALQLLYFALSTNAFNRAHGKYTQTEFNGLARLGTKTYAAMSDGLYRLDGEDDAGVAIEAFFTLGFEDFGIEAVKGNRVAYLGYTSDGPMELFIRTDTDGEDPHCYSVEAPHSGFSVAESPARVKLGRGLRGRYWQPGMRNVNGADFRIDRIGLGIWPSSRKR